MARRNYWTNSDGLTVGFGRRTSDNDVAATSPALGQETELVVTLTEGKIGDANEQVNSAVLPAGATIVGGYAVSDGAATSLVGLVVGTYDMSDTVDDADGILTAKAAADFAAGVPVALDGAQYQGAALTAARKVRIAATTASSAGDIKVVIRYVVV